MRQRDAGSILRRMSCRLPFKRPSAENSFVRKATPRLFGTSTHVSLLCQIDELNTSISVKDII